MKRYTGYYENVGEIVKRARIRKGLTLSQLAAKAGQQFNTVRDIEAGKRFQMHHIVWLVSVLEIPLDLITSKTNFNREIIDGEVEKTQEERKGNSVESFI